MIRKIKKSEVLFDFILTISMILVVILTIYPFINVLAISLNDSTDTVKGGIYLWPRVFTLKNYQEVLQNEKLFTAFWVSIIRTVTGTIIGVVFSAMLAYTLSRKDFMASKLFGFLFILTMYFGGGLIPEYILIKKLHLVNNFLVYILPNMIAAWNVFVLKSYIQTLPISLQESAKLDGASDIKIFYSIVFPLCKPVLATIALFIAVWQWNQWFDTYMYASSNKILTTLQFELMKILTSANSMTSSEMRDAGQKSITKVSPTSIRMSITIVATLPILLVYPFLQKYFVKGLTLGAVKN